MKVLITGGKGQLGYECEKIFATEHETKAIDIDELDITNFEKVESFVLNYKPDIIINCAAYTMVDACETDKAKAWDVNVRGPRNLAEISSKYNIKLVHISTDYVFDGNRKIPLPYKEIDAPKPLSYYGKTKFEGEEAINSALDKYIILRTAWLYGINGQNFFKTILRIALKKQSQKDESPIKVVNDQFGSPTWVYTLALQIKKLIENNGNGLYHATSEGYCSWYDFAKYFLSKMNIPHKIIPCSTEEFPRPASRPKNSILENERLKLEGMNVMNDWQYDVDEFISQYHDLLIYEQMKVI
ncbi:MAG: dTDP-4-dehydrorhamnose reductase [Desulfobacterales bacterium]|nr:dTDP-4-dehydrorhamnose reductase [Desulfobacterales bacterium]